MLPTLHSRACDQVLTNIFYNKEISKLGSVNCSQSYTKEEACECVTNYYNLIGGLPEPKLSKVTKNRFDSNFKKRDSIKKNLLFISGEIISLAQNETFKHNDKIGRVCSIDNIAIKPGCANKNDEETMAFIKNLKLSFKNEVKNGYSDGYDVKSQTFPVFLEPSLIKRTKKKQICGIPDSGIHKIRNSVNTFMLPFMLDILKKSVDDSNKAVNIQSALANLESDSLTDKRAINSFIESTESIPTLREFLNNKDVFQKLKESNFDHKIGLDEYLNLTSINSDLVENKIKKNCNDTFKKIENALCSNEDSVAQVSFPQMRSSLKENFNAKESIDDLAQANADLKIYCSNSESKSINHFKALNDNLPENLRRHTFRNILDEDHRYKVQYLKKNPEVAEDKEIGLCNYIPTPENQNPKVTIEDTIKKHCNDDPAKIPTMNCMYAKAAKIHYGDRIKEVEDINLSIKLAQEDKETADSKKVVVIDGKTLSLAEAIKLRDFKVDNIFFKEKKMPNLVAAFINKDEGKNKSFALAAKQVEKTPESSKNSDSGSSSNNSSESSNSIRTTNAFSAASSSNRDKPLTTAEQIEADAITTGSTKLQNDLDNFYSEVSRRITKKSQIENQKFEEAQRKIKDLDQRIANEKKRRETIPDYLLDSLVQPGSQEDYDTQIAAATNTSYKTDDSAAELATATPFGGSFNNAPSGERETELAKSYNNALADKSRADQRRRSSPGARSAASAKSAKGGGSGRGKVSLSASGGGKSISFDEETPIEESLNNIAEEEPEVAQQLLEFLEEPGNEPFIVTKGEFEIEIVKRGKLFSIKPDENNRSQAYLKFKKEIEKLFNSASSVKELMDTLRRKIKERSLPSPAYQELQNLTQDV